MVGHDGDLVENRPAVASRLAGNHRTNLAAKVHAVTQIDSAPVAAGLGVLDGPWLGLFEVVVHPDRRRRGHGRDLTRSLLEWGQSQGAVGAFLQVVSGQ